jgi:ankyrin repeat protein
MGKFDLNYNVCDNEGNTYLHYAIFRENSDLCKLLLHTMSDEFINKQNDAGKNVLHYAISGNLDLCKILLNKMSPDSVNEIDNKGNTLLHNVLLKNYSWSDTYVLEVFEFFLPKMSKEAINAVNKNGQTLLHLAIDEDCPNIVELLMNN